MKPTPEMIEAATAAYDAAKRDGLTNEQLCMYKAVTAALALIDVDTIVAQCAELIQERADAIIAQRRIQRGGKR